MDDGGVDFDCVVIGGYFGSGHRGGRLSSFLCGLRATENDIRAGANPEKCYSFCKVGGGFRVEDFADIRHRTEGLWTPWNSSRPPTEYIELGGTGRDRQAERPDVWIRPSQSLVISVKAASVGASDQFAKNMTLRFPRFKGLRTDKRWDEALDYDGFLEQGRNFEEKGRERQMTMEKKRRRPAKRAKRELVIAGQEDVPAEFATPSPAPEAGGRRSPNKVFEGLEFCVLTDCAAPVRKTKTQLETLIKQHGGRISQRADPQSGQLLLADKKVVKVASLIKAAEAGNGGEDENSGVDIIRPRWVLDCLAQSDADFLLPFEAERHLFYARPAMHALAATNTDRYGDSFARDLDLAELRELLAGMPKKENEDLGGSERPPFDKQAFVDQLAQQGHDLGPLRGQAFRRQRIHVARAAAAAAGDDGGESALGAAALKLANWIRFGGGQVVEDLRGDRSVTHVVVLSAEDDDAAGRAKAAEVRALVSARTPLPRLVTRRWVEECWENATLLAEERYEPL